MILSKKRNIHLKVPMAASVWYVFSNVISKGITFLFTPIFTRILTPAQYGIYSLYTSWMGIFTVLLTLETYGSVSYRGLMRYRGRENSFISSGLGALICTASAACALYIIFQKQINATTGLSSTLTVILILQIFLNGAEGFFLAGRRFSYKYKTVSVINVATGFLTPLLSVFIITKNLSKAGGRIAASLIISLIFTLPMIFIILKRGRKIFDKEIWKYLFGSALPMLPHYISLSVIAQSDKIIISRLLSSEALGRYHVAYSVGLIIMPITAGLSSALTPWITRKAMNGEREKARVALEGLFRIISTVLLMFFAILPEVFAFLGGKNFYTAINSVYPVGISAVFIFLSGIISSYALCFSPPKRITQNTLLCALISVILNLLLVRYLGIFGGAIGTLCAYAALFILNIRTAKKENSFSPIGKRAIIENCALLVFGTLLLALLKGSFTARLLLLCALFLSILPKAKSYAVIVFERGE